LDYYLKLLAVIKSRFKNVFKELHSTAKFTPKIAQLNLPPNFKIFQLQRCLVKKIKQLNPYEIIDYDLEHGTKV
jgi:preprotein translocase subunit Sec63